MALIACGPTSEQFELSGETMGTTYSIKLVVEGVDGGKLKQQVEAVFERIDEQMSTWRPDSEISRFNGTRTMGWFKISDEFMHVLGAAQDVNRQTGGAFDITVSGLVELWGFGSARSREVIPDAAAIKARLVHTGSDLFEIDSKTNRIRKLDPDVQIDLSGIAKGYGVDAAAAIIEQAGIRNFLVEIGGEIRAAGRRLDGTPWRVAIERPDARSRTVQIALSLDNAALATSGDYRDFFQIGDARYSHIIDPGTGSPSSNGIASVTVITSDAMSADALATGLMVMGKKKALALADRTNLAVMIIERDGNEYRIFHSSGFEALQQE